MGFTDILDGMFSLYRQHFRVFVGVAAVDIFAEFIGQLLFDCPHRMGTLGNSIFPPDDLILYIMMTGFHLALSLFTSPLWVIGVTLLYFNQRILKEGLDIQMNSDISRNLDTEGSL